jgi:sterol desaturase/sphingolipid hydroxylase (fatty acid hydroxylase superfamily)
MQALINFFNSLESRPLLRLLFLATPIAIFWFVESGIPLFRLQYRRTKWRHALVNFTFTLSHLIIHAVLAVGLVLVADWCVAHQFGLVQWLHLPVWATVVVGVLAMDFFGGWLVHFAEHNVPLLWRIHIVHHADNKVDVTSGLRHHPFEAVNRWLFMTIGVLLMGLPVYAVMMGQTLMSIFTVFTHANISLPLWLDKTIGYLFVSPNMHKVHHHYQQPYTDSNYGAAFSIWDRLLGTYMVLAPNQIRYGLDHYYPNEQDENLGQLLKSPFAPLVKTGQPAPPALEPAQQAGNGHA